MAAEQSSTNAEGETMSKTSLIKKLRMQPGHSMLIMNPPSGYMDELGDLPEGVEVAEKPDGMFDFVQLFVKSLAELRSKSPAAFGAVQHDGLLWISYPKKSSKLESDLSRGVIWAEVVKTGWRPVAQVSFDDVWSAIRLRPTEKVGK
jgi:hypothetical protein